MAGTMLALAVVEMQQVEAVQGRAEARVVPGALVLRLAGAAATPGRIVARPVVPGRVEPRQAEAAMDPVVVAAAPGTAEATVDLGAVEPIPAVPEVQPTAGMDLAAAIPGMTRVELVVATPAAVVVQIGPYLVEEIAVTLCARQRPEAQVYLVEKALAVPYVRRS